MRHGRTGTLQDARRWSSGGNTTSVPLMMSSIPQGEGVSWRPGGPAGSGHLVIGSSGHLKSKLLAASERKIQEQKSHRQVADLV